MREFLAYIAAALLGGLVKELNSEEPVTRYALFVTGVTSVCIGIVFGLLAECITKNFKISIAVSALAGVWGYQGLITLVGKVKDKISKKKI